MTSDRRVYPRPYFFEVFTVINLAIIVLLVSHPLILTTIPQTFASFIPTLGGYALIGVVIRGIIAAIRRELPEYLRKIRTGGWISDTIRLVFFGSLMVHTYFWIKLVIPVIHPRLYDQELWDLDQALFFGYSPNILFLNVFSAPTVLHVIDWAYARIFFVSMTVAFVFFLSAPNRRLRVAFSTGNTFMWIIGAWLYMLVPSLGPAFRFPDVWIPLASTLEITQNFQALLMRNYRNVQQAKEFSLMFGIAAFPSLHVAFQTFAFLWMRRLWIYGQIVFGVFAFVILIGSVVTGWHYLIDGIAGIVLAVSCYWIASRTWRIPEWLRLWRAVNATP